jgi:dihydrofolate reductase
MNSMTGKVIWHISMSLDGFIDGPNDSMAWAFKRASKPSPDADEVIQSTGAIPGAGDGGMREKPSTMVLDAAKGKDVVILGTNVAQQAISASLLDEILVHIMPVLLGDDVRLIEKHSVKKTYLETIRVAKEGQMTVLRMRALK